MRSELWMTLVAAGLLAATASGCGETAASDFDQTPGTEGAAGADPDGKDLAPITLTSPAFQNGATIPTRFTCDGGNISPPLEWTAPPAGTRSLVLVVNDPMAQPATFTHWVVFNLPPEATSLPEGLGGSASLADLPGASVTGPVVGRNDFMNSRYDGPCPSRGHRVTSIITLYAVNKILQFDERARRQDIMRALEGHVIGQGRMVVFYGEENAAH